MFLVEREKNSSYSIPFDNNRDDNFLKNALDNLTKLLELKKSKRFRA